jgi:hypothetical protein
MSSSAAAVAPQHGQSFHGYDPLTYATWNHSRFNCCHTAYSLLLAVCMPYCCTPSLLIDNTLCTSAVPALQNVYDKQCDVSLILKSVVLHAKQLTELHVEQEAQVSLKGMAYTAELPMLERLSVKSRNG